MLLCVALAAASGPAFAQTEGEAAPATATAPTTPPEAAPETPPPETPAAPPPEGGAGAPAGGEDVPWETPAPTPPTEPAPEAQPAAQPVAQPAAQGWGEAPATQPAEQGWGAPPAAGTEWGGTPSFELPEDQQLKYWPVLFTLGAGIGGTFEGTLRSHLSAVTVEPSIFIGFFKHWGIHHGPFLSLPFGMPGTYEAKQNSVTSTFDYGLSFGIVPGYRLMHQFRRDMWWGFGLGYPMLVATWHDSNTDEDSGGKGYTFIPGIIEVDAEFGYKFTAGMGVFIKAELQAYNGAWTQLVFGGVAGLVLYYDWFRPWEPPAPSAGEVEDLP